jgi:hypothetical protein
MSLPPVVTKNWALFVSGAIALAAFIIFAVSAKWDGLTFKVQMADLAGLLAPLVFASAVVERAVEILVSPWRDAGASKLEKAVAAVKARPVATDPDISAKNEADLKVASAALDDYRGETQKYAFAVSLTLSAFVAISGVRAFWPFTNKDTFATVSTLQHNFFVDVDVVISAAVLAGGADGIHSIVNAVTSFFDNTAASKPPA